MNLLSARFRYSGERRQCNKQNVTFYSAVEWITMENNEKKI